MNLFELFVKIGVDDQASDKISNITEKLGNGLNIAAKVGTAAVTAATGAIVALTKTSIDAYAEYEQLVGGAELMFGDAFEFVQDKAAGAYKTVQMSQNEYLQQVNGFATGLKTALGGNEQAAAELADRIITAEADVVAATGNSQEAVQNAFNGIMRSNYTMLDNLQLGITPTKEGFQEVIDKVNEWNEAQGKATDYQIDNLADAQSALLDYIEMQGLSGYASLEASKTITGSVASMKSAWTNLITGMSNQSADVVDLTQAFSESIVTVVDNVIPVVETALDSFGIIIEEALPAVLEKIPQSIFNLVPRLFNAGMELVEKLIDGVTSNQSTITAGVGKAINFLVNAAVNLLPKIVELGITLVLQLAVGLIQAIPELVLAVPQLIYALLEGFDNFSQSWKEQGHKVVDAFKQGIADAWNGLVSWFNNIWDSLFGNREVGVNVSGQSNGQGVTVNGSHAGGLGYVPYDGYIAELHKGERVLTADEAMEYNGGRKNGVTVIQYIYSEAKTAADLMQEALYEQEKAVYMSV